MKRFVDVWPVVRDRDLEGGPWKRLFDSTGSLADELTGGLTDWLDGRPASRQLIFILIRT